jgi:hypothetical protein
MNKFFEFSIDATELMTMLEECKEDLNEIKRLTEEFNDKYDFASIKSEVGFSKDRASSHVLDLVRPKPKSHAE